MSREENALRLLLRLFGAVVLLAWLAVFLPVDWMAAGHRWLGLGEFPASPLVDYLTRSISALYGIHGGLMVLVSTDVRRYREIILYLGAMNAVFGVLVIGIDLHAGLPAYWTWGEGPPIIVAGAVLAWLARRVGGDQSRSVSVGRSDRT